MESIPMTEYADEVAANKATDAFAAEVEIVRRKYGLVPLLIVTETDFRDVNGVFDEGNIAALVKVLVVEGLPSDLLVDALDQVTQVIIAKLDGEALTLLEYRLTAYIQSVRTARATT